ncbi:hypothetical protein OTU49_001504, partial [Cherax quadricarinatus]
WLPWVLEVCYSLLHTLKLKMVSLQMVAAAAVVTVVVCGGWCGCENLPQELPQNTTTGEPQRGSRSSSRRTATSIPAFVLANVSSKQQPETPAENVIGKSPCPRGTRGQACRWELARNALSCTSGPCEQCSQGCSSVEPSLWPTCCRDHFLCCRQLASACQQCNTPQLSPFCTAAFKKCT